MKIAQRKYNQAGIDFTLSVYFDLKAFDLITPAMAPQEEEDFIRLVCDSLAAAMPKESGEKNFYIKKILKYSSTNTLKMLCSDGFLIDTSLTIPASQQAFANERIKITDIDQLPTRLNFSNDLLKSINDRLFLFEENMRKELSQGKISLIRETLKQGKPALDRTHEFTPDKAFDVLAEISHVKKEIRELVENSTKILNTLMEQVNGVKKRIHDDIMKETKGGLQYEDNKNKLEEFAQSIMAKASGGDVQKNTGTLTRKINEITPIYSNFAKDLDEISERVTKQTDRLGLFKQYVINALFESASQYHDVLLKQMQDAAPNARKIMLSEFNKKFAGIATMSDSGELSSLTEAEENLGKLSLDNLQEVISNDGKENPGLLQKCNTSWTEESAELQIVMKNIGQLNGILSSLFKEDPQFEQYAHQDMIQVTRIPFPRSFQFKFSNSAMNYKNAIEDFCKMQKDAIVSTANNYKKTLQVDDVRDKVQRALVEIQKQAEVMKKPVTEFRDALKRKEISGTIVTSANADHEVTEKYSAAAKQLQNFMRDKIDPALKNLLKKISNITRETNEKVDGANKSMQQLIDKKSQIDLTINHFSTHPAEKPNLGELDEKIRSMEVNRKAMMAENSQLQALNNRLAVYEDLIKISEKISQSVAQSDMRKQQHEAKTLLLQLIKNQSVNPAVTEQLKKQMIELYTKVDTNVVNIEKMIAEIATIRKQIFDDFNTREDTPTTQLEARLHSVNEKLQSIETVKLNINENLSHLRKLTIESTDRS